MDLPNSVCDHGLSGFWNRILVASVTARAGLSDAEAISYIQYIGVVIAGLPSDGSTGGRPNSPIGMFPRTPVFAPQHCDACAIKRQCAIEAICTVNRGKNRLNALKTGLIRRSGSASRACARCA